AKLARTGKGGDFYRRQGIRAVHRVAEAEIRDDQNVAFTFVDYDGVAGAGRRIVDRGDGEADLMGLHIAVVVGDADGKAVDTVEVGVRVVGPGAGGTVDGRRAMGRAVPRIDAETGGCHPVDGVRHRQGTRLLAVLVATAAGIAIELGCVVDLVHR